MTKLKHEIIKTVAKKSRGTLAIIFKHEFGESTTLTSDSTTGFLNCKGWCLDDHLISLEIEYSNIDDVALKKLKDDFEKQFDNYKIIWSRL